MILCQPHWRQLRVGLGNAGVEGLIADTRDEAMRRYADRAVHGHRLDNFDPVAAAVGFVTGQAVVAFGAMIVNPDADGRYLCPPCELNRCFAAKTPHAGDDMLTEQTWAVRDMFLMMMAST